MKINEKESLLTLPLHFLTFKKSNESLDSEFTGECQSRGPGQGTSQTTKTGGQVGTDPEHGGDPPGATASTCAPSSPPQPLSKDVASLRVSSTSTSAWGPDMVPGGSDPKGPLVWRQTPGTT